MLVLFSLRHIGSAIYFQRPPAGILTTLIVNPIWVINTRLKLAHSRRLPRAPAAGEAREVSLLSSSLRGNKASRCFGVAACKESEMRGVHSIFACRELIGWYALHRPERR